MSIRLCCKKACQTLTTGREWTVDDGDEDECLQEQWTRGLPGDTESCMYCTSRQSIPFFLGIANGNPLIREFSHASSCLFFVRTQMARC
jgi:hypothetical protein